MPFQIIRDDITHVKADAIVNTANPRATVGYGTDSAIYAAAGWDRLLEERKKIGEIAPGECAVTEAYGLKARYIIHTVGPVWQEGSPEELRLLDSCYRKSLLLAKQLGCESIAFPLISSRNNRFPKDKALTVALDAIRSFLKDEEMDVTLVVYDREAYALSEEMTGPVMAYIDDHYRPAPPFIEAYGEADDLPELAYANMNEAFSEAAPMPLEYEKHEMGLLHHRRRRRAEYAPVSGAAKPSKPGAAMPPAPAAAEISEEAAESPKSLKDLVRQVGETFQERLLRLIDERELTDPEVYKKANIDRKLFSKIRSDKYYQPKKRTALALALALELNLDETIDLIGRAGYALSPGSLFDIIVEYCIEHGIYDLYDVNALLFDFDQVILS